MAVLAAALALSMPVAASATSNGVTAWGENFYGELGVGSKIFNSDVPLSISGLSGVTAVSAGDNQSLALMSDGTVMAWGANEAGQLGDGLKSLSRVPVQVAGLTGVTAAVGGQLDSLALLGDGTVRAWGTDASGQLGDGRIDRRPTRVPVAVQGLSGVTALAAGGQHSLALLSDGTVMAWGGNGSGELGDGSTNDSAVPVPVRGLSGVTAIAAGANYSLALLSDGTVRAWGAGAGGQLGDGTTSGSRTPVTVSGLTGVTAISGVWFHSLALLSDGTVMAWGADESGELGNGEATPEPVDSPVAVGGLSGVTKIAAGYYYSLALLGDGTVVAWGNGEEGTLGTGNKSDSHVPVAVPGLGGVLGISAGSVSLSYGRPGPPSVRRVAPRGGAAGGGEGVTISGEGFTEASAVSFGGTAATSFTVESAGSITAVAPPGASGTVDVTVTTPGGTSAASSLDRFRFWRPTITELSTHEGGSAGGTSVTVTGSGFDPAAGATGFDFGSEPAADVQCNSTTTCTLTAPARRAGVVAVTARVAGMHSLKDPPADQFTYM